MENVKKWKRADSVEFLIVNDFWDIAIENGYTVDEIKKDMKNNLMSDETIKEDKMLFYNDLSEYKKSIQGGYVRYAIDKNNKEMITMAFYIYWYCRNASDTPTFTYASDDDKLKGIENDRYISDLYKQQN